MPSGAEVLLTRVPTARRLPPQPKHARSKQRYPNYVVKLWTVFVPADRCTGRVLSYEDVLEFVSRQAGKLRRPLSRHTQRQNRCPLSAKTCRILARLGGGHSSLEEKTPAKRSYRMFHRNCRADPGPCHRLGGQGQRAMYDLEAGDD
jgi:hypothetical protein